MKGLTWAGPDDERSKWTLFALALADGHPLSPVQLQKAVFLLGERLGKDAVATKFYNFKPYNYGPFDADVYTDAERLVGLGMVQIEEGVPSKYRSYEATEQGIEAGRQLFGTQNVEMTERAKTIVDWVRKQTFAGLVGAIYNEFPAYAEKSIFKKAQ